MASANDIRSNKLDDKHSPRRTRSRSKPNVSQQSTEETEQVDSILLPRPSKSETSSASLLPSQVTRTITGLDSADHALLLSKERCLRNHKIAIPAKAEKLADVIQATLIFAQEEAGTAVCISPNGFLLTCSHCVAEGETEYDALKSHWLLFASGRVVEAKTVGWDAKRDLALLQILASQSGLAEHSATQGGTPVFPSIKLAATRPPLHRPLVCVGHPGSEDLESDVPGVKTNYDVLHVSTGTFRGYAPDQDVQDNSEIGALKHNCWTYWGHSGAPLIEQATGKLVGLHSSWDEKTGMRRGVPLEAVHEFLRGWSQVL